MISVDEDWLTFMFLRGTANLARILTTETLRDGTFILFRQPYCRNRKR